MSKTSKTRSKSRSGKRSKRNKGGARKQKPCEPPKYKTYNMPPWFGKIKREPHSFCDLNAEETVHQCYDVNQPIILPGTRVYHGTLNSNLVFSSKYTGFGGTRTPIIYFGLDVIISLIYLQELNNNEFNEFGYLYEFQVDNPIPYLYQNDIQINPGEISECETNVCVHPQLADPEITCHENTMESTEMTIPIKQVAKYLKYVCRYTVDINLLNKHDFIDDTINPVDAIIAVDIDPKYDPLIELRT